MAAVISAGFKYCFYGTLDSSGYLVGGTDTAPVAGNQTGSPMLRLEGASTAPVALADAEVITVIGDDEPLVTFQFSPATLPAGVMEMVVRNRTFEALIQGTQVQTLGDLDISVLQPTDQAFTDMVLILSRRAKSWTPSSRGVKKWENLLVMRPTITPLFSEFQTRANTPYRYGIATSQGDRLPWGVTLIESVNGTTAAPLIVLDGDNPVTMHRFTGNNSATVFNLAYEPVSGAKTKVAVNGVLQTLTTNYTVDTAAKTVTFLVAPASSAIIVVFYEVSETDYS